MNEAHNFLVRGSLVVNNLFDVAGGARMEVLSGGTVTLNFTTFVIGSATPAVRTCLLLGLLLPCSHSCLELLIRAQGGLFMVRPGGLLISLKSAAFHCSFVNDGRVRIDSGLHHFLCVHRQVSFCGCG